jgi:hypothetical protein
MAFFSRAFLTTVAMAAIPMAMGMLMEQEQTQYVRQQSQASHHQHDFGQFDFPWLKEPL